MKVIVSEGRLGLEYIADAISSCEQNGIECIADDANGVILFYDPKGHKYADSKYLMNADTTIHELLQDSDLYESTMKKAEGEGFKEFSVQWNSLQKKEDGDDVYKSKTCNPIRGNFTEGVESAVVYWKDRGAKPLIIDNVHNLEEAFEDIRYILSHEPGDIADIDHIKIGSKVYDKDDIDDYLAHEHELEELDYTYSENIDNRNDWSASEGEVEIMWTVDYPEFGIESGNTESFVVDYDDVVDNEFDIEDNSLREEICRLIGKEYPDLDFDPYDFDILNEREFWGVAEQNRAYPYDESDGEFETMADIDDEQIWSDVGIDDNDNVVEGVPNWATSYIMYGDDSRLTQEEVAMVDKFVENLEKDGLRLSHPISGSENEFNSYPVFGDACDTVDWSCEVV